MMQFSIQLIESTLRVSTPLLLAAMGGLLTERAGVINVALEGMMLVGAFAAAAVTGAVHSAFVGLIGGGLAGMLLSVVHAVFAIEVKANQIVVGTALNLLAAGITAFLTKVFYQSSTSTPSLPIELRFQVFPTLLAWLTWGVVAAGLKWTRLGLWLQFAGEHPAALRSAGVSVRKTRWIAVLLSGLLAGWAGAALSIYLSSSFTRNMTAGQGFMALAALIFGKWQPVGTAGACLLFGLCDALQMRVQGVMLWGDFAVPVQLIQILPYVLTIVILAGWVGKAKAPRALGIAHL